MSTDISYNNVREEIVKILTNKTDLGKYIINIPEGKTANSIFSRNTKFPIEDMLAFMIMPRTESTAVELSQFAELTGREQVCKQTFFIKRQHLSDGIFDEINRRYVDSLYFPEAASRTWHGLYLMAFDGTTLKLPDTPDVNAHFTKASNHLGESQYPMARMEVLKDVLNGHFLDLRVDTLAASEPAMAVNIIKDLPRDLIDRSLFIFDRGYKGAAWFTWLALNDIQYVVRLQRGFNNDVDAFYRSDMDTADVLLNMSSANWSTKGRKAFAALDLDPERIPPVMLHLVKCTLVTGQTEVLAVRINQGSPSSNEAYVVYRYRWGVETSIGEDKNELQLEIFSGNSVLSVLQDIKAKIIAYNLGVSLAMKATESLERTAEHPTTQDENRRIKVNLNIGWHYLKETIVRILLSPPCETERILTVTLKNLKKNVEEYELDRHLPHPTKSPPLRGKYITYTNYKRAI